MPDRFALHTPGLDAPASDGFAIVPNNDADLPETTRAIYAGGGGSISLVLASGTTLSLVGIASGTILPLRVRRVRADGTSATSLLGLI